MGTGDHSPTLAPAVLAVLLCGFVQLWHYIPSAPPERLAMVGRTFETLSPGLLGLELLSVSSDLAPISPSNYAC